MDNEEVFKRIYLVGYLYVVFQNYSGDQEN